MNKRRQVIVVLLLHCFWNPFFGQNDTVNIADFPSHWQQVLDWIDTDDYEAALTKIAILEKIPQLDDSTRIEVIRKAGVCYYYLDQEANAIKEWERALALSEQYFGAIHEISARLLFNIASANRYLYKYDQTRLYYDRYLSAFDQLPIKDSLNAADNLTSISEFLNETGDLEQAKIYGERALSLIDDKKPSHTSTRADILKNLSFIYTEAKDFPKALSYLLQAKELRESVIKELHESVIDDKKRLSYIYQNIGIVYLKMDSLEQAIRYSNQALRLSKELKSASDIATVLSVLAVVSKRQGKYDQSLKLYEEMLRIRKQLYPNQYRPEIAGVYENMGEVYWKKGNLPKAQQYFNQAMRTLVPTLGERAGSAIDLEKQFIVDKNYLLRVLALQGNLNRALFVEKKEVAFLEKAHHLYSKADSLLVLIRKDFKAAGSKFSQISKAVELYETAIANTFDLYTKTQKREYLDAAYQFSARNKAIILLEGLQEQQQVEASLPQQMQDQKAQVDSMLRAITLELQEAEIDQATTRDSLYTKYFSAVRAKERLLKQMEEDYPKLFRDNYAFINPLTIRDLQGQLEKDRALIEYFYGQEQLFVFLITADTSLFLRQEKLPEMDEWCIDYRRILENQASTTPLPFSTLSHRLYQQLFPATLQQFLSQNEAIDRLTIIPDNLLYQTPFAALLQADRGEKISRTDYLLNDYAISYLYNNHFLQYENQKNTATNKRKPFAGFGLEYDTLTLRRLGDNPVYQKEGEVYWSKLQFSELEVAEIAALLGGDQWKGRASTRENFTQEAANYQILHLSLHALINENYPEQSALVFYGGSSEEDYLLRSLEIYNLDLNNDLAVLSACNTATGTINQGEGMRSLARSFAYAGCPSIVASQWPASEKSTKDILLQFYENLRGNMPKDRALQQAKLEYLHSVAPSQAVPAYWAHLIAIGNSDAIEIIQPWSLPWALPWALIGGIGIGCLIVLGFFLKRKKQ